MLVEDCKLGTVVKVYGTQGNYYLVVQIGSQELCAVNLEGVGYVSRGTRVESVMDVELHVLGTI